MTPLSDTELIQRLLLAAAVGGLLGAERELRRKSAGFRTNILIALGAAIFTIMSVMLSPGAADGTRIAAQIVTGIGFLGAGTILHNRDGVKGLTTAATVWVNAALGVAAGGGQYRLVIIGGAIVLTVLLVLGPIEAAIEMKSGGSKRTP
jgi:putative Mg2+ transporter-C (MgtC) family protein